MEGLERILEQIVAEANASADSLRQKAQAEAAQKRAAAEKQREEILDEAKKNAAAETAATLQRAKSLAASEQRKQGLASRQNAVEQVLAGALSKLQALPAAEKATLYAAMVKQHHLEGGEITLPAADAAVAAPLLEKLGSGFTIAPNAGAFGFGLKVQNGSLRDDLSYELALRDLRPQLSAFIAGLLAAPGEKEAR